MTERRAFLASTALLAATVTLAPLLPSVDFPQHVASAEILRRLLVDPAAAADVMRNPATHNAGVQVFAALVGSVVGVELAGRLFFALALVLQAVGFRRLVLALGLPEHRALVIVPVLLGFSMVWGLANFAMGTGLSLLALALLVNQIDKPSRALVWLPILSLLISITHVMTMLLLAVFAAGLGLEQARRRGAALLRTACLGALLLPGCGYDLWVLSRHLGVDAGSYTTASHGFATPGPLRKLALLGTLGSGLYASWLDIVLVWLLVAALAYALVRALRGGQRPAVVSVLGLALTLYLSVPSVFLNTHLVYQRLAFWIVLGLALALPEGEPPLLPRGLPLPTVLSALALGAALLAPVHFAVLAWETRDLRHVLARVPPGARLTGVIESPRSVAFRTPTLQHVHALAVAHGASDATFSFARYLGGPVVYRPDRIPPYPSPSWEHDARAYRHDAPLARAFPFVLHRLADARETTADACTRLFQERCGEVLLVGRRGDTLLWDSSALR